MDSIARSKCDHLIRMTEKVTGVHGNNEMCTMLTLGSLEPILASPSHFNCRYDYISSIDHLLF